MAEVIDRVEASTKKLSREEFVYALARAHKRRLDELQKRLDGDDLGGDLSEVDPVEIAQTNGHNLVQRQQTKHEIDQTRLFKKMFEATTAAEDPLSPGGIVGMYENTGETTYWYFYDPKHVENGACNVGVLEVVARDLGVDRVVLLSVRCHFFVSLFKGKLIRKGTRLSFTVDGNPDYVAEVIAIL